MTTKYPAQGFTLVEVMVAMVVFSLGVVATLTMTTGSVSGDASARSMSGSAEVAAEMLETLTSLPYNDVCLQDDPNLANDPTLPCLQVAPRANPTGLNLGLPAIRNPLPTIAQLTAGIQDRPDPAARPSDYQMTTPGGDYTIYWNVAENTPVTGTKTIMVIVTSTGRGPQKTVILQHIIPERT